MSGASSLPGVEALRAFTATRVAEYGLGQVARDIGLPKSGLKYFLEGASPRRPTLRKLENWYLRIVSETADAPACEAEAVALALLLRDFPEPLRQEAHQRVLSLWGELFDSARLPQPLWLRYLQKNP